jgi:copper resistance protein C
MRRRMTARVAVLARVAVTAALLFLLPAAVWAHVTLVSSAPAAGEVVAGAPTQVRVVFSGRVEAQYSTLTVFAPDGSQVALGSVVFAEGSDREFMAAMPPVSMPGRYTVRWRTAGADGHVLEGSFAFTLDGETAGQSAGARPAAHLPMLDLGSHAHDQQHDGDATGSVALPAVLARWLHFLALTLLVGGVTFRLVLMPRITEPGAGWAHMQRRAWRTISVAALLLAVAAVLAPLDCSRPRCTGR